VYVRCGDNLTTFLANCTGLRPVQTKEIKEVLSKQEKISKGNLVKLFEAGRIEEEGIDSSTNAKEAKEIEAGARNGNAAASAFEAPQRDTNH